MIITYFIKYYHEFVRNKVSVGLVFVFPLFFLFIFNLAFGGAGLTETTTYNIAIINNDTGIPESMAYPQLPTEWLEDGVGANLTNIIFDVAYEENGSRGANIFESVDISSKSYDDSIRDGDVVMIVIVPENFSLMVLNMINNDANLGIPGFPADVNETIIVMGLENSYSFPVANSIVQSIISSYLDAVKNGDQFSSGDVYIDIDTVLPEGELDIFDFIAAGLFVFGTVLSAAYFSAMILNDQENQVFNRVKLSMMNPRQYITAFILFAAVVMMIQAIFLFLSARWIFDFNPAGSFTAAFFVLFLLMLANFGLIFTIGAYMQSPDSAGNAIGTASPIIGFASGAFFQMPNVILVRDVMSFTSGSPHLLIWDIFPWTHAVNALRAIFLYDQSLAEVAGDIAVMLVMGIVWFMIGVTLFSRRRFVKEE